MSADADADADADAAVDIEAFARAVTGGETPKDDEECRETCISKP